jgi:hypothetical protein
VVGILVVIIAIALSSFVRARNQSEQNACIGNLRIIDAGKEQWALEKHRSVGHVVTTEVDDYIKGDTMPWCPSGGTYTYNEHQRNPTCNITMPTSHRLPTQ